MSKNTGLTNYETRLALAGSGSDMPKQGEAQTDAHSSKAFNKNLSIFNQKKGPAGFLRDYLNKVHQSLSQATNEVANVIAKYDIELPKNSSWHKHSQSLQVLDLLVSSPSFDDSTVGVLENIQEKIDAMQNDMPKAMEGVSTHLADAKQELHCAQTLVNNVIKADRAEAQMIDAAQNNGPASAA